MTDETERRDLMDVVLGEITGVVGRVDREQVRALADVVGSADRVFVAGEGRSGFVAKAFAMRLMHLGLTVYVVGETVTPALRDGDTVVAVSGSGTTAGTVRVAEQAATVGAKVYAVTTEPDSPLAQQAAGVLVLPAATKQRRPGEAETVQPLSSLFDQVTHVTLDVVCLLLAERRHVDNAQAAATHANTE